MRGLRCQEWAQGDAGDHEDNGLGTRLENSYFSTAVVGKPSETRPVGGPVNTLHSCPPTEALAAAVETMLEQMLQEAKARWT
jgi:hypothetical protein